MTNAQTEARALWAAVTEEVICNDGDAIEMIATALAAKDAELERRDMQLEASAKVALDLSAQLAEANKALEEIENIQFPGWEAQTAVDHCVAIARRAREQGGE